MVIGEYAGLGDHPTDGPAQAPGQSSVPTGDRKRVTKNLVGVCPGDRQQKANSALGRYQIQARETRTVTNCDTSRRNAGPLEPHLDYRNPGLIVTALFHPARVRFRRKKTAFFSQGPENQLCIQIDTLFICGSDNFTQRLTFDVGQVNSLRWIKHLICGYPEVPTAGFAIYPNTM